jgi:predicted MFS family arabinose efflux permease
MALTLFCQGNIPNALYWIPLRGIEGYVFGLGFQSGIMFATRITNATHRLKTFASLAQGALVATIVGPIIGGTLTRIGGTIAVFYLAAALAMVAGWLASRIAPDRSDGNARSTAKLLFSQEGRRLALPLFAMGVSNRFVWFSAVGLLLPAIVSSQPLGAAAVGELIGLLGLGMYLARRGIDCWSFVISPRLGWLSNGIGAFAMSVGYTTNISVWIWMPVAFVTGAALSIGSRAQQDWIQSQQPSDMVALHGVSRLADRGGSLLAGIMLPPLYGLPHFVASLVLISMVGLSWLTAVLYTERVLAR